MKWSALQIATATAAAKRFPERGYLHTNVLHDVADGVGTLLTKVNDRFATIEDDAHLTAAGRQQRKAEHARAVLAELEDYAPLKRASSEITTRIEKLQERMKPTLAESEHAAELRAFLAKNDNPVAFV